MRKYGSSNDQRAHAEDAEQSSMSRTAAQREEMTDSDREALREEQFGGEQR